MDKCPFKVGQKVMCIDAYDELIEGQIYTINLVFNSTQTLRVDELGSSVWWARRFIDATDYLHTKEFQQDMHSFLAEDTNEG